MFKEINSIYCKLNITWNPFNRINMEITGCICSCRKMICTLLVCSISAVMNRSIVLARNMAWNLHNINLTTNRPYAILLIVTTKLDIRNKSMTIRKYLVIIYFSFWKLYCFNSTFSKVFL